MSAENRNRFSLLLTVLLFPLFVRGIGCAPSAPTDITTQTIAENDTDIAKQEQIDILIANDGGQADKADNPSLHNAVVFNNRVVGTMPHTTAWGPPGKGDVEVVQRLISEGADINEKAEYGLTPLIAAAFAMENVEVIQCLIANGADVNPDDNMPL